jgi:hypothetical protein
LSTRRNINKEALLWNGILNPHYWNLVLTHEDSMNIKSTLATTTSYNHNHQRHIMTP